MVGVRHDGALGGDWPTRSRVGFDEKSANYTCLDKFVQAGKPALALPHEISATDEISAESANHADGVRTAGAGRSAEVQRAGPV